MTLAICQRCGHERVGAFAPCPACGHESSGDRVAEAKALLLSDLHATPDELRTAAVMIKEGIEVPFARSVLDRIVAERAEPPRFAKKRKGRVMVVWSPIGFVVLLGVLEAIHFFFRWMKR